MHGTIEISDTGFSNMAQLHETSFSAAIMFKNNTKFRRKKNNIVFGRKRRVVMSSFINIDVEMTILGECSFILFKHLIKIEWLSFDIPTKG